MADFHPATKIVPRAIVLQIVEGGEVDVHHATLIWDAVLPSGKVSQQHSTVDTALNPKQARKLLWDSVVEVQRQEEL